MNIQATPDQTQASPAPASTLRLQVSAVIDETADARSLVFDVPQALRERFAYKPGQFLSFRVTVDGKRLTRCYSMSSSPWTDAQPQVTIKRVEGGRVSNWMNQHVQAGDWLDVLPPAGHFCLDQRQAADASRPLVLFGGGSGITPVFSLLKAVLHSGQRPVLLVYANRDEASVIFRDQLRLLTRAHPEQLQVVHVLDSVQGFLDAAQVRQLVRHWRGADYFICGPGPFMDTVETTLLALGEARDSIHVERFVSPPDPDSQGAAQAPVPLDGTGCELLLVELDGVTHQIVPRPGETLLQSCRSAGLDVPYSCEEGFCGACMCTVEEGQSQLTRNDVLSQAELAAGWTLACQGHPQGARVRLKFPA
ncbi:MULTISPECIES: ferredoxin--NADP reductase [Pseudomonas]|uniref:3-ketosteroid-9-alpha-hydroxylase n=1 Tax=Pseudomonas guariconensis TaxID=1288410 RepID=A0AAX0VSK8_9PSED|nr:MULTISPECIES: ferredoxin--NADP reductase [Pseudomonas]MBH3360805.1 ferredoxin--NADP reductase [Pseudomonas guariconensis]MEB3842080.1 ferredoxin--NADP reductase [Pseudomonas guariconensis]MEB3874948.1 ferredoxin--NADP reductase [Pseudomonas guariconensis]MEB3880709.1 ferredoxin--NADP reductase [Pseudomonas guariconensis]MEB3897555.1 ferredoxin--NADP reductase [Pseudomonas guariconensis]